jgi:hypothetical protein
VKRTAVRRANKALFRVVEADGELVRSWLPGLEADSRQGPLDRGGFQRSVDAWAFSLGVDHERALRGHLGDVTPADIEQEREALDLPGAVPTYVEEEPALVVVEALPELPEPEPPEPEPPKVYTERDELLDDLKIELRLLWHRLA